MPNTMDPCVKLPLEMQTLREIAHTAKEWAHTHGFIMRLRPLCTSEAVIFAPFMLLPSRFPRREFTKVKGIQADINELIHAIAYDTEFLKESLKSTIVGDVFTRKLWHIYETVTHEGISQPISLGILRTDYMLHPSDCSTYKAKQVEINTISIGLGALSVKMTALHRFILKLLEQEDVSKCLPANYSLKIISMGLVKAWNVYNKSSAVILFIVENDTFNNGDQRLIEFSVLDMERKVRVIRRRLCDVADRGNLLGKALFIDNFEVAVVYFRDGYAPDQYTSESIWDARLMIERSLAIKCPSIGYHLAGTKKIQQILALPGIVERFIEDKDRAIALRDVFAAQFPLGEGDENIVEAIISDPEKYVLKPQREGGGNNLYGIHILKFLEKATLSERSAFIAMERLYPPSTKNYLVKPDELPDLQDVVGELGIFGVILGSKEYITMNSDAGYLLRSKLATCNEGGVARGFSALDTPCFC